MSWKLRTKETKIPKGRLTPQYDSWDLFSIKFHHSGKFQSIGNRFKLKYVGGKSTYVDYVDCDKLFFIEIQEMLKEIGHNPTVVHIYQSCVTGDSCDGLLQVVGDVDVLDLRDFAGDDRQVCMFVDHMRKGPKGIACYISGEVQKDVIDNISFKESETVAGTSLDETTVVNGTEAVVDKEHVQTEEGNGDLKNMEVEKDNGESDAGNEKLDVEMDEDMGHDEAVITDDYIDHSDGESVGEVEFGSDYEHSDYYEDSDGNYDLDNEQYAKYVDHDVEWSGVTVDEGEKQVGESDAIEEEEDEEEEDCDPIEHKVMKYKGMDIFNPKTDMKKVKLKRGLCFTSQPVLKEAIKKHSIQYGRDIEFPMNKSMKVKAICCNETCPWMVYASRTKTDNTFIIKTYGGKHTCRGLNKVSQATSTWLAKKYGYLVKLSDNLNISALIQLFREKTGLTFSEAQMYRFRRIALNKDGEEQQYGQIYRLAEEIFRSNKGSTVKIKTKTVDNTCVFQRMYICWDALRQGMLTCRRVIFLDGCHIKNKYGGILLTACGIDANNGLYPFAYAVVEKENKESQNWFLEIVCQDLGIKPKYSHLWTLMLDKHKGLVDAIKNHLCGSEMRFCVYHLYANFKLKHKGLTLKEMVWRAAKATRVVDFNKIMNEMKNADLAAYEWFKDKPPSEWSKAFFSTTNKSDVILNNLSECLNALLLTPRKQAILQLMDSIRLLFMKRIALKRQQIMQHDGLFCPRIEGIIQHNNVLAMGYRADFNGHNEFHVEGSSKDIFVINVDEKTCSCRRWQLTGIPCAHAISCFFELGIKVEEMVDECYSKESYLKTYGFFLHPMVGEDEWPEYTGQRLPVHAPIIQSQVGRPKRYYRRLQVGEKKPKKPFMKGNKLSKHGTEMHCSVCHEVGHNKAGHLAFKNHEAKMKSKTEKLQAQKRNVIPSPVQNEVSQEGPETEAPIRVTRASKRAKNPVISPPLTRAGKMRKRKVSELEVPLVIKEPTDSPKVKPQTENLPNNGKAKVVEAPAIPKPPKKKGFKVQSSKPQGEQTNKKFVPPRTNTEAQVQDQAITQPQHEQAQPVEDKAPSQPQPQPVEQTTRASTRILTRLRAQGDVFFSNKAYDSFVKKMITKRGEEEPLFQ